VQSLQEKPTDTLVVHLWPGATKRTLTWYTDDGVTFDHEKGVSSTRLLTHDAALRKLVIGAASGSYKPHFKHVRIVLHATSGSATVRSNGKDVAVESQQHAFLGGIQKFDPLGGPSDNSGVAVRAFTVPLATDEMTLSW
jgi:alpha-glucosidase